MLSNRMTGLLPWGRAARASHSGRAASDAESTASDDASDATAARTLRERNLSTLLFVAATNNTACNLVTPFIPLYVLQLVGGDPIAAAT